MPDQWGNPTTADMAEQARQAAAARLQQGAQPWAGRQEGAISNWINRQGQTLADQLTGMVTQPQNLIPGPGNLGGLTGIMVKPYNQQMLEEAIRLSTQGRSPGEIWRRTQTEYSPLDRIWTQEVPGATGRFRSMAQMGRETDVENFRQPLSRYINNPELFNLQPQMRDWPLIADPNLFARGDRAVFTPGTQDFPPNIAWNRFRLTDPQSFLASINHELQHGYNWLTGRPFGQGMRDIEAQVRAEFPHATPMDRLNTAVNRYWAQPTEQEARLSSWRGRMTPIQRQSTSPYESLQQMLERERYER